MGATLATGTISGGQVLASKGLSIDMGNKVSHRKMLGGEQIRIGDRSVSGQMAVDLTAEDEISWRSDINAVALTSVAFQHGTAAGKRIAVFGGRVQRTNPQAIDDDGSVLIQSDLRFLPGQTGAPEITIIAR